MSPSPPAPETETASLPETAGRVVWWQRAFPALRHRNFRLFLIGLLISSAGSWMENAALGWLVYKLTGSKALLGEVAAAGTAPMVFLSMSGAWVADHYSKRKVLVITQAIWMTLAFTLFVLVWAGVILPWHIIVISLLNGTVMAFDMPARQAFLMEMTSRDELMNAISLNSSVVNAARIIGPALAGVIMLKADPKFCFLLNGASFMAAIVGLLMMQMPAHVRPIRAQTALKQAIDGFRYVWNDFRMLVLMTLFAVVGTFGWSYGVLLPAFASDILHLEGGSYGILMAFQGVGAVMGGLLMASLGAKLPKRGTMFGSIWFFSTMLVIFAFNRNYHTALLLLALNSFGMMLFFSMSSTLIQTSVPDEMRGRVMGVWSLLFGGVIPLGSMEVGYLAQWVGIPATIATGALICAATAAVTLYVVLRRNVVKT